MICGVSRGASAMRFPDVEIIMHADSAARLTDFCRKRLHDISTSVVERSIGLGRGVDDGLGSLSIGGRLEWTCRCDGPA
ncbi:MAG: hypothetical protein NTZ32_07200 [Planctomycetales bacterium]|nr:hypothetical protein [Planctomycetales bacterium]